MVIGHFHDVAPRTHDAGHPQLVQDDPRAAVEIAGRAEPQANLSGLPANSAGSRTQEPQRRPATKSSIWSPEVMATCASSLGFNCRTGGGDRLLLGLSCRSAPSAPRAGSAPAPHTHEGTRHRPGRGKTQHVAGGGARGRRGRDL